MLHFPALLHLLGAGSQGRSDARVLVHALDAYICAHWVVKHLQRYGASYRQDSTPAMLRFAVTCLCCPGYLSCMAMQVVDQ